MNKNENTKNKTIFSSAVFNKSSSNKSSSSISSNVLSNALSNESSTNEQSSDGNILHGQKNTIYIDDKEAIKLLDELRARVVNKNSRDKNKSKIHEFENMIMCEIKTNSKIVNGIITGIDGYYVTIKTGEGVYNINAKECMRICYSLTDVAKKYPMIKKEQEGGKYGLTGSPYLATSEYMFVEKKGESESSSLSELSELSELNSMMDTINSSSKRSTESHNKGKQNTERGKKQKYMKAGRGDKIGIISPEEKLDSTYYSESSSIEEGLCE